MLKPSVNPAIPLHQTTQPANSQSYHCTRPHNQQTINPTTGLDHTTSKQSIIPLQQTTQPSNNHVIPLHHTTQPSNNQSCHTAAPDHITSKQSILPLPQTTHDCRHRWITHLDSLVRGAAEQVVSHGTQTPHWPLLNTQ